MGKGQPGALKLPHTQGPGRGPIIIGVLYAALLCFLHKRLFPGLEPVTFQSYDNNFTSSHLIGKAVVFIFLFFTFYVFKLLFLMFRLITTSSLRYYLFVSMLDCLRKITEDSISCLIMYVLLILD